MELDVEALNRRLGVGITAETGASSWGGERLDLGLAIDALLWLEGGDEDEEGRRIGGAE